MFFAHHEHSIELHVQYSAKCQAGFVIAFNDAQHLENTIKLNKEMNEEKANTNTHRINFLSK